MARIVLEHLTKRFRAGGDIISRRFGGASSPAPEEGDAGGEMVSQIYALDDLNLVVENGETIAIVGPSGSGKSTLLRVVAGLEDLDGGRVLYDDRDVTNVPPKDRGIGMVFQNYALYPHMESRTNIGFFLLVRKRADEIPDRVRIVSDIMGVGFEQLLEKKPKQLSGGQQQRVAIARCIARDPDLFLLDEPLSNLDAKLRVRTRVEIKRLLNRFSITTLYVTHDQVEAIALGDRIAVMRRGRIEQIGPYREVHGRPRNVFVATFVGVPPMNILRASVDGNGSLAAEQFALSGVEHWQLGEATEVLAGIRSEDVRVDTETPDLRLRADVIEPLVQERMQLVHGTVGQQQFVAKIAADHEVQRGDDVPLSVDREHLHLFDAASEERLPRQ
ncbi:MAG: ABC transporter ATP-binding protein [Anaerolineae bacterium]